MTWTCTCVLFTGFLNFENMLLCDKLLSNRFWKNLSVLICGCAGISSYFNIYGTAGDYIDTIIYVYAQPVHPHNHTSKLKDFSKDCYGTVYHTTTCFQSS